MLQAHDGGTTPALGPLSRALEVDGWLFVAGTVGTFDDGTLPATVEEQAARTLENVASHLRAAGMTLDDVVSTTIYLTARDQYKAVNDVYRRHFEPPYPARATVVCEMVHEEHLVEMSAVARRGARS